jgi:plasmid stabilization system protein ParE
MGRQRHLNHADLAGIRVFRVPGFERMLVFYRPQTWGVDILRVVDGSRDLEAVFSNWPGE